MEAMGMVAIDEKLHSRQGFLQFDRLQGQRGTHEAQPAEQSVSKTTQDAESKSNLDLQQNHFTAESVGALTRKSFKESDLLRINCLK